MEYVIETKCFLQFKIIIHIFVIHIFVISYIYLSESDVYVRQILTSTEIKTSL